MQKSKQATAPSQQQNGLTQDDKKNNEPLITATQKTGCLVSKTVLWLMEIQFFKSSFVVKVPPCG